MIDNWYETFSLENSATILSRWYETLSFDSLAIMSYNESQAVMRSLAMMRYSRYQASSLENLYALVRSPTVIFVALSIFAIYEYLLFEGWFDSAFNPDKESDWTLLPSYNDWVAKGGIQNRGVEISEDDICIICRDTPEAAVRISKCKHAMCSTCWTAWTERGNVR